MNTKHPEDKPASNAPPPYPGYPPPYAYYPQEEETSLLDHWDVLVKYKLLIASITIVSTAIAVGAALYMTPIYRAEILLAPVSAERSEGLQTLGGQFGDLAALTGISLGRSGNSTEQAIATLKSRVVIDAFIKEEKLLQILFSDKWNPEKKQWKDTTDAPTAWDAYKLFNKTIRFVTVDRRTGLVSLAIEWKDPLLAARWANRLVKRVNSKRRADAIRDAEKSIVYLKEQLAKTNAVEIQQAIFRLIEAQTKTKMLASTREEYAFKVIDPAVPPEEKAKPNRTQLVVLAFLGGLMVAVFIAFLIHHVRTERNKKTGRS